MVLNWVQKADLQPIADRQPARIVINESAV